mgnify:CR=1 FL=1
MALAILGFPFVLGLLASIGFPRLTRSSQGDVTAGSQSSNLITDTVSRGNYRVYLLAHYDSKGQGITLLGRMLCVSLLILSFTSTDPRHRSILLRRAGCLLGNVCCPSSPLVHIEPIRLESFKQLTLRPGRRIGHRCAAATGQSSIY